MTDRTAIEIVCVHGERGYCSLCAMQTLRTIPGPIMPMGCICPPGANRECENPVCPRKAGNFTISYQQPDPAA